MVGSGDMHVYKLKPSLPSNCVPYFQSVKNTTDAKPMSLVSIISMLPYMHKGLFQWMKEHPELVASFLVPVNPASIPAAGQF